MKMDVNIEEICFDVKKYCLQFSVKVYITSTFRAQRAWTIY